MRHSCCEPGHQYDPDASHAPPSVAPMWEARREAFDPSLASRCPFFPDEAPPRPSIRKHSPDGRASVIGFFSLAFFPFFPLFSAQCCIFHFFREVSALTKSFDYLPFTQDSGWHPRRRLGQFFAHDFFHHHLHGTTYLFTQMVMKGLLDSLLGR